MKHAAASLFRALLLGSLWLAMPLAAIAQIGTCEDGTAEAYLETANVRARVYNTGPLFWKGAQNFYEVPKDGGVHALFASHMVIGGLIDGRLHMAASTYGPYEFWPGPLDAEGNPPADCSQYDRIWEINNDDFVQLERDSVFSSNMLNWPWHLGAPVVDGDGVPNNYNLEGGDRPELLGHQTLWWVMNDRGNEPTWSELNPIGVDVRVSAYGFDILSEIGDITFYRYSILNKNTRPLTEAFFGMWADPDLGNASDDYFGSDSLLHMGFAYNEDNLDESGYEEQPPAIGYTFLKTPNADVDLLDNNHNGRIDEPNEPASMHAAVMFLGGGGVQGDPGDGNELYTYLKGQWTDGQPFTVGGYGRDYSDTPTRFLYSGDPLTQSFWTPFRLTPESEQARSMGDVRFMISSGPFTLSPGESKDFLVAIVWAQGNDHLDSVRKLKTIVANLQASPDSYLSSGYQPGLIEPLPPEPSFVLGFDQNFPNPFSSYTTLRYSLPKTMQVRLAIYDILGRELAVLSEGTQEAGVYSQVFDGSRLAPGIYYARMQLDHLQFSKKLVRVP
ncbi:MAG: T9SS type A sorting domain-containing protein [Rhodothermaceae bacterium]|nr:T9SS type A sorting domain-containing protein [Rhodothermaceae bacterium]